MDTVEEPITTQVESLRSVELSSKKEEPNETNCDLVESKTVSVNKWSWSSWLMGAPPLDTEEEILETNENIPEEIIAESSASDDGTAKEPIQVAANWLWSGASHLVIAAAEKSSTFLSNAMGENEDEQFEKEYAKQVKEEDPNVDLWCNMKHDFSELACTILPADVHNSHISQAVYSLGNKVTACLDGIASVAVSSFHAADMEENESNGITSQMNEKQRQIEMLLFHPETFHNPPHPQEEYELWIQSLQPLKPEEFVDSQSESLSSLLLNNTSLSSAYCLLVPRQLSYVDFFLRFLFRRYQLEKQFYSPSVTPTPRQTPHKEDSEHVMTSQPSTTQMELNLQEQDDLILVDCSSKSSNVSSQEVTFGDMMKSESSQSKQVDTDDGQNDEQKESEDDWEKCG